MAFADIWPPTTHRPVAKSGSSLPSRGPASLGTIHGRTKHGEPEEAPRGPQGATTPRLISSTGVSGNPAPDFSRDARPGDNLFTNSVSRLHATSGKLAWHFQFTPHDDHDWDSTQTPILADVLFDGTIRKVICWANGTGSTMCSTE